jgi:hypothetical protein
VRFVSKLFAMSKTQNISLARNKQYAMTVKGVMNWSLLAAYCLLKWAMKDAVIYCKNAKLLSGNLVKSTADLCVKNALKLACEHAYLKKKFSGGVAPGPPEEGEGRGRGGREEKGGQREGGEGRKGREEGKGGRRGRGYGSGGKGLGPPNVWHRSTPLLSNVV